MIKNVGWVERTVRFLLGLPTAIAYMYVRHFSTPWADILLVIGLALLATAGWSWCPVHHLCGSSTFKPAPEQPATDA
jgi:hypothetical protein